MTSENAVTMVSKSHYILTNDEFIETISQNSNLSLGGLARQNTWEWEPALRVAFIFCADLMPSIKQRVQITARFDPQDPSLSPRNWPLPRPPSEVCLLNVKLLD